MLQDDNPFAPSESPEGGGTPHDRVDVLEPVPMNVGAILTRCWEVFTNNIGVVLAAVVSIIASGFVFGVSGFAIDLMTEIMSGDMQAVLRLISVGNSILQQLVTLFFTLGAVRIFIHVTRGQEAEASMLVSEGASVLPALGAQILIGLAALLSVSPGLAAVGAGAAGAMSLEVALVVFMANILVVLVPWVVIGIGLQFVQYVIVDRGVGPIEAIKESWRLTEGYKMSIFGINLLAVILVILVLCCTLGLAYLVILPVLVLMQGVMYHSLTHYQGLVDDP